MMKKHFFCLITLISLFTLFGGIDTAAQVPFDHVVSFPSRHHLYYDSKIPNIYGEHSNIDLFFSEWEEWSELIKKGAVPSEYNSIFQ